MNNCKSKEWVKRKKKKGKEQYQNCMGKNVQENNNGGIEKEVQENSNEEMETTMLEEMENSEVNDEEMFDF